VRAEAPRRLLDSGRRAVGFFTFSATSVGGGGGAGGGAGLGIFGAEPIII
jgi:hypothetical protein